MEEKNKHSPKKAENARKIRRNKENFEIFFNIFLQEDIAICICL